MAINFDNFRGLLLMAIDSNNFTWLDCGGQMLIIKKELLLKD